MASQVWKLLWLAWHIASIISGKNIYPVNVHAYIQDCLVLLGATAFVLVYFSMNGRFFEWRKSLRALVAYDMAVTVLIDVSAIYNSNAILTQDGLRKGEYYRAACASTIFTYVVPLVTSFLLRTGFVINCIFQLATTATFMWVFSSTEIGLLVSAGFVTATLIWVFYSIETQQRVAFLKSLQYSHMEHELQTQKETSLRAELESVLRKQEKKSLFAFPL